jgi:hypothetical protein
VDSTADFSLVVTLVSVVVTMIGIIVTLRHALPPPSHRGDHQPRAPVSDAVGSQKVVMPDEPGSDATADTESPPANTWSARFDGLLKLGEWLRLRFTWFRR